MTYKEAFQEAMRLSNTVYSLTTDQVVSAANGIYFTARVCEAISTDLLSESTIRRVLDVYSEWCGERYKKNKKELEELRTFKKGW